MSGAANSEKVAISVLIRPLLMRELQRELKRMRVKEAEFSIENLCSEIIEVWCAGRRAIGDESA